MTIEQILAAEIPEGKYHEAMRMMKMEAELIKETLAEGNTESYTPLMIASYCAAFEALYKLASGFKIAAPIDAGMPKVTRDEIMMEYHRQQIAKEEGRKQALDEVSNLIKSHTTWRDNTKVVLVDRFVPDIERMKED